MRGNGRITVLLADDHTLFRAGIREMLSGDPEIEVIDEVATGDDAISMAVHLRPRVLLLDVEMPGPGAAEVIRQVRRQAPEIQVVVLTMHDDAEILQELLECGAAAYLVKTILRDELFAAVRSVVRNSRTVLLSVSRETVELFDGQRKRPTRETLTTRELEVIRLTAQAFSNAAIAAQLHITEATVKRHLTNAYAKLNAVSRVDAVRKALAARLITLNTSKRSA